MEILQEEYAKFGVHLVGNIYWRAGGNIVSRVPINGVDDLKGTAFRASELSALCLAELGAGTIWTPGTEIYTNLATGVVDAAAYSGPPDNIAMGFHEVTSYWIRKPTTGEGLSDALIVNLDVWQALPDDLKAIVEAATEVASARNYFMAEVEISKAWAFAEEYGITIIEWSEEDQAVWYDTRRAVGEREYLVDAASTEYFEIAKRFMIEMGYWAP